MCRTCSSTGNQGSFVPINLIQSSIVHAVEVHKYNCRKRVLETETVPWRATKASTALSFFGK